MFKIKLDYKPRAYSSKVLFAWCSTIAKSVEIVLSEY